MASFEQLKREAVRLERSLEDKVSKYQQVRVHCGACLITVAAGRMRKMAK
jgi:hypothetical protein